MENNAAGPHPAQPAAPAAPQKKKNNRFIIIILTAVVLGAGFSAWFIMNPSLNTDNAMVERTKATVSAKMVGLVAKINVKEGDFAAKGTLLVELETSELQAQKKQAEANLIVAQGAPNLAKVSLDKAQADFARAQRQYNDKIISTESYEHTEKALQSAQVDFNLAMKKVEVAQAQLDLINATLNNARMTAPFDAVVAKKWMNEGDVLQPGQPILTMFEQHRAWVTANFEETKISRFKVGQNVDIHIDAYPGVVFHGKVEELGVNTGNQFSLIPVNNAAGNFTKVTQRIPVKIQITESTDLKDPQALRLLPGMSAVVDVRP